MKTTKIYLLLTLLLTWATGMKATDFITDVMVIGGSESETNSLKASYTAQGWHVIQNDLNENAGGDYIYLLYKTDNSGVNNEYITDFFLRLVDSSDHPETLSYNGRIYTLTPGGGDSDFNSSGCDLNHDGGGKYIYLYYTKDTFDDLRAVTSIWFNDNSSNAVPSNGGSEACDLNKSAGGDDIFMHFSTQAAKTAQALWCSSNSTLYFICSDTHYVAGSTYRGNSVTNSWSGYSVTRTGWSDPGWYSQAGNVAKVEFDLSFADIRPRSLRWWFCNMSNLTEIEDIKYLNTSEVTVMNSTFYGCSSLSTLDLNSFDVSKVTNATSMFSQCSSLTTIYCENTWNLSVSDYMFSGDTRLVGAVSYSSSDKVDGTMANPLTGFFTRKWRLTVNGAAYGKVTASKLRPYTQDDITLTVIPMTKCTLSSITLTGERTGNTYSVTDNGNNTLSFKMPAEDITVDASFEIASTPVSYVDLEGNAQTEEAKPLASNFTTLDSGWWVVNEDFTTDSRLIVSGDVNLILCDGATLTNPQGTTVNNGKSLTVWAQSEGTGAWVVSAPDDNAAGIGGRVAPSGNITINGGRITATGGKYAAGIGGGYLYQYRNDLSMNNASSVTINGGTITATGGLQGAGIGCGTYGGATVTINGGVVNATGGTSACGIGDGYYGNGSTITLTYTDDVSITADTYKGSVTLDKDFIDGTTFYEKGVMTDLSQLSGKTLLPFNKGDVNMDGEVNVTDVTALVAIILGNVDTTKAADVNKDQSINVSDVTWLVSIILGTAKDSDEITGTDGNGDLDYGGSGSGPARAPRRTNRADTRP